MNNHRKGINNRFNLQICYNLKFRTLTVPCMPCLSCDKASQQGIPIPIPPPWPEQETYKQPNRMDEPHRSVTITLNV